ncbi:hypothetical protein Sjap_002159 [Stephania japonica]|uniref:25S rRNA (uridine-N(3))-methyltransferase BMT5-like domain-containing protein n=1 Tax=Stephania japonica TaxID=461633 RepID=A0AAP0KNN6_9MAGN
MGQVISSVLSSADDTKEVNPLSIAVDNGKRSIPYIGDFDFKEFEKCVFAKDRSHTMGKDRSHTMGKDRIKEFEKCVFAKDRSHTMGKDRTHTMFDQSIKQGIWIKHYCSSHKILLVGEGDFSFSACLGRAFGRADNMLATSLNTQDFLKKNYGQAMSNIQSLRSRGCKVIHEVNATEMAGYKNLNVVKYDRIVFNFPHAGFSYKEYSVTYQVRKHQNLVSLFMANAAEMIEETGEIHISHKCNKFFEQWGLQKLAEENGLVMMEEVKFNLSDYPGYNTKYGYGGDKNFNCNPSKTYKFRLKRPRPTLGSYIL